MLWDISPGLMLVCDQIFFCMDSKEADNFFRVFRFQKWQRKTEKQVEPDSWLKSRCYRLDLSLFEYFMVVIRDPLDGF